MVSIAKTEARIPVDHESIHVDVSGFLQILDHSRKEKRGERGHLIRPTTTGNGKP